MGVCQASAECEFPKWACHNDIQAVGLPISAQTARCVCVLQTRSYHAAMVLWA